ncbi:Origin recognition complex subunit 5 [Thelohanellus kitauei]|uniref:Origin recognition complex subunit 5 n=1 Tax=Thelohanellus kitauei TaxID=669202 RepID=A0A0C2J2F8_THEKT|nr:Origin recognition complex subunit 5 [Thelohanellus kitauei]
MSNQSDFNNALVRCLHDNLNFDIKLKKYFKIFDIKPMFLEENLDGSTVIIFDRFDCAINKLSLEYMKILFKLHEYINCRVLTIFLSSFPLSSFDRLSGRVQVLSYHFSAPNFSDINQYIIDKLLTKKINRDCLELFCEHMVKLHWSSMDLMRLIQVSKYFLGKIFQNNKKALKHMELMKDQVFDIARSKNITIAKPETGVGLSKCLKFLCVAAFLAARNPEKNDDKLFAMKSEKCSKRKSCASKKSDPVFQSKSFTLERVCAIFQSIAQNTWPLHHLHTNVSTLVVLKYIVPVSPSRNFAGYFQPRYKLSLDEDVVRSLSETIDFDLNAYMSYM